MLACIPLAIIDHFFQYKQSIVIIINEQNP